VRGAPAVLDSGGRNASSASVEVADASIQTATQHVSATVDASQLAEQTAIDLFDTAAEADVDKALDDVLSGLRAVEGLEDGGHVSVGLVSRGFASAEFVRLVEGAVKAKLKAEAKGLIRARLVGKTARGAVEQDELDRFMENAAAAVETALSLVYKVMEMGWEAKSRVNVAGGENYVYVFEKTPRGLKVYRRDVVYFLRYEAGDVVYGGARAEGVVVLVLLGGEKTIRIEVLAKSVVNIPARFEEVEWGGERWARLATVKINKPKNYVVRIEPRLARLSTEVSRDAAGVEGLRGLLVTDVSGKEVGTPDPLLVKLFAYYFKKVKVEAAGVSHTEAGPALIFRAVALDDEPFRELFGDIAERYGKELKDVVDKAKGMWLEVMRKLSEDIKRVAEEAAKVGKREGVEAGRRALVEGLRHLFEEKEREALNVGRSDEALAIAVAGRLMVGVVNSPVEWFSLLVGDGVVDIAHKTFGFSAKYTEVAETVLYLLNVWARAYGTEIRAEEGKAMFASSKDAARVLKALLTSEALKYATALVKSWSGLAGSDAPKVISLLALAQLLGVVEGKWAVELWLAHKVATTPKVAKALSGLFSRVESVDKVYWAERGVNLYFKLGYVEGAERAVTLRLHTDLHNFYLYCHTCSEASAERVLKAVAEDLRPCVEQSRKQMGLVADEREWPKWYRNAIFLSADVGWPMFLKLWEKYNVSLPVEREGRELLRVEVLDARLDGSAKFRLWFYKWRMTRPLQPYEDIEITYKGEGQGFKGYVFANKTKGIRREHLAEIAQLLRDEGVEGVSLKNDGRELQLTGAFRDSVLSRLGIVPELPRAEPIAVEHLGGSRFKIGGREVEFGVKAMGARREFGAVLKLATAEEAVRYAASLKAIGVDAEVRGNTVRLDSDSFFGLLAVTGTTPPDFTPLYRSEDLQVYASVEEGRVRYYFAVKHEGVWRIAEGLYVEKGVQFSSARREVLEAVRGAVVRALERLGHPAEVGEPNKDRDEEGNVKGYYLYLYGPHLVPFLKHTAERVRAEPAEVRLEGRRIVVKAGGVKAVLEFKLLKHGKAEHLTATDMAQTLALYKSLKAIGVPVEITPRGVKVSGEAMWALVAVAVERGAPSKLPAEVMPGVELMKVYNVEGVNMYMFRAEGVHYYFAVRTKEGWSASGGKLSGRVVDIFGEALRAVADALNAIYSERGVERRVEVKKKRNGVPYIRLTGIDLELLGLTRP